MNGTIILRACVALVALSLPACDLLKKLADKEDKGSTATSTSSASGDADGLPRECVDYLLIFKCVNVRSDPATAQSQVDGLRAGFKALVTTSGAAAAQKQCADLLTSSEAGFAKVGCTKSSVTGAGAPAAAAPATPSAAPTTTAAVAAPKSSAVAVKAAPKKAECSCGPGQVLFSDSSTVICVDLPCRSPGGSCKKADGTSGSCLELGTGEAGQRVRCGHLVQCM